MKKNELQHLEYDVYYKRYIDKLSDENQLIKGFIDGKCNIVSFFESIPKEKLNYRYQANKWSVKEILQHLIDVERIFIYRCFRIARRDQTALSGFDQEIYIQPSKADEKSVDNLLDEFTINRDNSIALLKSLTIDDLCFVGNANSGKMSARAAAFTIIGHDIWHIEVIKNKYL